MSIGPIVEKSKVFALRIIRLRKYLTKCKREFVLSRQVLRSGTSIGANVREAIYAYSKVDFISKMTIALKESSETAYWLELLHESGYMTTAQYDDIYEDCCELVRLLTAIVKTSKQNR